MKKILSVLLLLCTVVILFHTQAHAVNSVIYSPGCEVTMDVVTFTILEAGFTKKAEQSFYLSDGDRVSSYYEAKDGNALFSVKGVLQNTSSSDIGIRDSQPILRYGQDRSVNLIAFPNKPSTELGRNTLAPGAEVGVLMFSDVPAVLYYSSEDFFLDFFGASIQFRPADVKDYVSLGFASGDGVEVEDVTLLSSRATAPKPSEKPHIDELGVEGVRLEKSSGSVYQLHAKIRNLYTPLEGESTPDSFMVAFQLLDAAGDAIPVNSSIFIYDLENGQGGWCSSPARIDSSALNQAETVRLYGYEIRWSQGGHPIIKGKFSEPQIYMVDELLNPSAGKDNGKTPTNGTVEEIDAALQGYWNLPNGTRTLFLDGLFLSEIGGKSMGGEYEVNIADSTIDLHIQASDGKLLTHLPFTYDGKELRLWNNQNDEYIKE